jgi:hypothetical protein
MTERYRAILMRVMTSSSIPITLWPSSPILPLVHVKDRQVEGGSAPLPSEWIMRDLFNLNLDRDVEVQALLDRFPWLWSPAWPRNDLDRAIIPAERHRHLRSLDVGWEPFCTVEDARWCLKALRALVNTWICACSNRDPLGYWADEGFITDDPSIDFGVGFDVWRAFTTILNSGLQIWTPGSRFGDPADTVAFDLFTAGCQQLFNYMVTKDVTPRRCENANCQQMFVHQLGGPGNWHRNKGVRYCSPKCARAEAQRQYRRRSKTPAVDPPGRRPQ